MPRGLPRKVHNRICAIHRFKRIPADTTDVRAAIKREIWVRGFTLAEVAKKVRITPPALRTRLGAGWKSKRGLSPRLVDQIGNAIGADAVTLVRWHVLGAQLQGWRLPSPETRSARG